MRSIVYSIHMQMHVAQTFSSIDIGNKFCDMSISSDGLNVCSIY